MTKTPHDDLFKPVLPQPENTAAATVAEVQQVEPAQRVVEFPVCASPLLLKLARDSAGRCESGCYSLDAVAAVVLSWAALEAMLNELAAWLDIQCRAASLEPGKPTEEDWRELLGELQQAEMRRAQPLERLDLVVHKLTGEGASRGQGARQQLGYLAKLRNALVHFDVPIAGLRTRWATPEEAREEGVDDLAVTTQEFQPPRWLRALESKALLLSVADKEADAQMDWSLRVCSREVADWAVSTIVDAMEQLANSAADGSSLRRFLVEETGGGSSAC